jgi:hypothetical protein
MVEGCCWQQGHLSCICPKKGKGGVRPPKQNESSVTQKEGQCVTACATETNEAVSTDDKVPETGSGDSLDKLTQQIGSLREDEKDSFL